MAARARGVLVDSLRRVLAKGQHSDLMATCGSDTYKVHRVIVCERSAFIAGALRFRGVESADHTIDLSDEEPAIVELLVQYLYEGDYEPIVPDDDLRPKLEDAIPPLLRCSFPHTCGSYSTAEKRFIYTCREAICPHHTCQDDCDSLLGCSCDDIICEKCVPHSSTVTPCAQYNMSPADILVHAKMYAMADCYIVTGLKALAIAKFKHAAAVYHLDPAFPAAARYVFHSTPDEDKGLRKAVGTILVNYSMLTDEKTIKKLLRDHNDLAVNVIEQLSVQVREK